MYPHVGLDQIDEPAESPRLRNPFPHTSSSGGFSRCFPHNGLLRASTLLTTWAYTEVHHRTSFSDDSDATVGTI